LRYLAADDTPHHVRIRALVIVDENVSQIIHLSPWDLRVKRTELRSDFSGRLANDLEVSAYGIKEDVDGY